MRRWKGGGQLSVQRRIGKAAVIQAAAGLYEGGAVEIRGHARFAVIEIESSALQGGEILLVGQCVYFHLQIVYGKRGGNGFGCA